MATVSSTNKLQQVFQAEGRLLKLPRAEVIQSTETADNLCFIKSGYVKKYLILNDGNIRVQIIYGPGDIFPLTVAYKVLFDQELYAGPETYYYETMCKTEIATLDKNKLKQSVDENVYLYRDLMSESGRRLYCNIELLENLGLPNYYQRVAHQIAFFAVEFGEKKGRVTRVKLPLTQQDLADLISTTRETVSLCMSRLKKKGLISPGRNILVPDINKLKDEAFK